MRSSSWSTGAGRATIPGRQVTRELVVGVDVGSQGTCAQAIAPDGERVATAYVPHTLSYPSPGGRSRMPAVAGRRGAGARRVQRAADGTFRAVAFGSQLDGLVAADAGEEPVGPALIWMDRRATAQCEAAAEWIDPDRLRELSGCNLDPGHVAAKIAWHSEHRPEEHERARWFLLPGSFVAWHASASWRSIPRTPRPRCSSTSLPANGLRRHAPPSASTRRGLPTSARRTRCWDRWLPG